MWMTKQFDTKQRVGERSELRAKRGQKWLLVL